MKNEIIMSFNKTVKLTNVVVIDVQYDKLGNIYEYICRIDTYLKSKGTSPVGPLIQKTEYHVNDEGQFDVKISLMRQANNFIHNVEPPYTMESVLRVKNCMYACYTGHEEKLKLA